MPHVLEIKGGELLTPINIFQVMDAVEEYMGTDVRQYLEEYLEDQVWEPEEITDEEIVDHYRQVLLNIKDEAEAVMKLTEKSRMEKKAVRRMMELIIKMIGREI